MKFNTYMVFLSTIAIMYWHINEVVMSMWNYGLHYRLIRFNYVLDMIMFFMHHQSSIQHMQINSPLRG